MTGRDSKQGRSSALFLLGAVLLIVLAAVFVFGRTIRFDFVNWDDDLYVYHNEAIRSLGWSSWQTWFTRSYVALYVPVTMASYALDFSVYGLNPAGFHFTNLLLHAANGVLVFFIFRLLLARPELALLGALLFTVHPVQADSVAWVSERKNLLFSLFFLLGFYLGIKGRGRKNRVFIAFSILCFLLSLLSKPAAIMIPFVLLVYDQVFLDAKKRESLILALFLLVPAAAIAVFTLFLYPDAVAAFPWRSLLPRLLSQALVFFMYLKLVFVPFPLDLYYDVPALQGAWFPVSVLALCAIGALVFYVFSVLWKKKREAFWLAWFILFLIPVVNIFPVHVSGRHLYLPLAGIIGFLLTLTGRVPPRAIKWILAGAVVFCLPLAVLRTGVWKNSETLWKSTRHEAFYESRRIQLAAYYEDRGDWIEAADLYWGLIEESPRRPYAYINLYNLYQVRGKQDEAALVAQEFQRRYTESFALPELYRRLVQLKKDPEEVERLMEQVTRSRHSS